VKAKERRTERFLAMAFQMNEHGLCIYTPYLDLPFNPATPRLHKHGNFDEARLALAMALYDDGYVWVCATTDSGIRPK
jgi:hypothetical protein